MSEVACSSWLAPVWLTRPESVALSFSMPLTVLICASCEVSSAFCIGLSGSWLFSCVTSSLRKRCSLSALDTLLLLFAAVGAFSPLMDEVSERAMESVFFLREARVRAWVTGRWSAS
ncbi:hypothetical protein D3C72_2046130 [compost metagenome]